MEKEGKLASIKRFFYCSPYMGLTTKDFLPEI
jgi:hypothetical protein